MALRNMLVRVGADVTGLSAGLKKAQKDVAYFGRNVTGSLKEIQGKIAGIASVLGGGMLLGSSIQDAMRYEALMTTLGETLGESRKQFEQWQKDTGTAMGFSMLQGAELANMLSLNFKSIATDTADLTNKTTKMMELAAVISNKRGMAMTEVSDRIRSAMNQEADGAQELGVDVRIAAIKAGQAYQEMANGAPWDQLSENMRKTILYHHIFEQVSKNLGLTMQDTTAQRMAVFTASLANVRLALGQAFLPILHVVLPILTTLANMLIRVLQIIGAFFRALFGGGFKFKAPVTAGDVKTTNQQAKALDGVGDSASKAGKKSAKAGKEAKKAWSGTFGFDEVHTIKDPEPDKGAGAGGGAGGGGGGGGGGIGGMGGLEMPAPDFNPFDEAMDALAERFKKYTDPIKEIASKVWTAISEFAIEKFNMLSAWWTENGTQITEALKNVWNFIMPIITFVVGFIWESIKGLISGVITFFQGLIEFFTGIFTGDWQMAWEGVKKIFIGAFQAIWNFTNLTFIGGLKKGIVNLVTAMLKSWKTWVDDAIKFFQNFWTNCKTVIGSIKDFFKGFVDDLALWWDRFCMNMALRWVKFKDDVINAGKNAWQGIKDVFNGAVDWFARVVITPIINRFESIKEAFKGGITQGLKAVLNAVRAPINELIGGLNSIKNKIPLANMLPNIPKIPAFAQGGITAGPMLAMVGDNVGGREVIAPLDRLQSMLTNSVIQAMQLGNTGGNQGSGDVVLNIDGRSFARIVKPFLDREQNRVGNDVRIRSI
jgi:hypothetical protein